MKATPMKGHLETSPVTATYVEREDITMAFDAWNFASEKIKELVGENQHQKWFEDVIPLGVYKNNIVLQTSAHHATLWIKNNYLNLVNDVLKSHKANLSPMFVSPHQGLTELKGIKGGV